MGAEQKDAAPSSPAPRRRAAWGTAFREVKLSPAQRKLLLETMHRLQREGPPLQSGIGAELYDGPVTAKLAVEWALRALNDCMDRKG